MNGGNFREIPPFRAGFGCRCPRCGIGKLYTGLLTIRESCAHCALDLGPHDSGDGPSVFVILILGAIAVPAAFFLDRWLTPPAWSYLVVGIPLITGLAILMLRPFKALFVALHYKNLRHEYHDGG